MYFPDNMIISNHIECDSNNLLLEAVKVILFLRPDSAVDSYRSLDLFLEKV